MPGLTSRDYLDNRSFLEEQRLEDDAAGFGNIPTHEQRDLHDYYAPSIPLTDSEALQHRTEITIAFPSLPQKAGRAFIAFRFAEEGTPNQIVDTYRAATTSVELIAGKHRALRISGIARLKVDHYRLARALLNLERHDVDGKNPLEGEQAP